MDEARLTGDPGFYTLARSAAECALLNQPGDPEARRLISQTHLRFHRFTQVEEEARALLTETDSWQDHLLLGDALMEQGRLVEAAVSYKVAVERRPGPQTYDRIAHLRWLIGDLEGALDMERLAARAATPQEPEAAAWVLTRLGWLEALAGGPTQPLDQALAILPDYPPARLARGRLRLHRGNLKGAREDLLAAGRTVAAARALEELDPDVDVRAVRLQDPRGYAMWLAEHDAEGAVALLEAELAVREDAVTRMALAYARFRTGLDTSTEAREVLASGILEPETLWQGAQVLGDPALLLQAKSMGPGLLPSQHALDLP